LGKDQARKEFHMSLGLKDFAQRNATIVPDEQIVTSRSELLGEADRGLLRAVWVYHQPIPQVSRLSGVSERTVRRRASRLVRRIYSQRFLCAARLLPVVKPDRAAVLRARFLQGLPVRHTAEATGIPYDKVRRIVLELEGMITALCGLEGRPTAPLPHPSPLEGEGRVRGRKAPGLNCMASLAARDGTPHPPLKGHPLPQGERGFGPASLDGRGVIAPGRT
jgi:DNA-directed RNA polymerase specialized sigma24 family protein